IRLCGGMFSHSFPRIESSLIDNFSHLQVLIEESDNQSLIKAIYPLTDLRFKNFSWAKYFCYSDRSTRPHNSYMGNMIPIQEVYQLIREIYKVSCLKSFF